MLRNGRIFHDHASKRSLSAPKDVQQAEGFPPRLAGDIPDRFVCGDAALSYRRRKHTAPVLTEGKKNMTKGQAFKALIASASLMPLAANALSIDEFTTVQGPLEVHPQGPTQDSSSAQTLGTDIVNGERDMFFDVGVGLTGGPNSDARVEAGQFSLANNSETAATIRFQWDGADGDPDNLDATGLGGIDLTEGFSLDAFEIQFLFNDVPSLLTMTVHTDGSNSSSITWPNPALQLTGGFTLYVPFAAFSGSADFTNVGAIELSMDSPFTGLDVRVDHVRTVIAPVPVPAGLLLFASGLFGLGFMRRH